MDPAVQVGPDPEARVAPVRVDPAIPVDRVARADMARVTADMARVAAADTAVMAPADQADTTPEDRVDRVDPATQEAPVVLADPVDRANPEATTRADMTPVDLAAQASRADTTRAEPAIPAGTTVDRVRPGRMPEARARMGPMAARPRRTAEPPLRMPALLPPMQAGPLPSQADRRTPADRRWDPAAPGAVTCQEARTPVAAIRLADRTLRLAAIRPVGAIPEGQ